MALRLLLVASAASTTTSLAFVVIPQQRAAAGTQEAKDLPEVRQLLEKPQHVLDTVGSELLALRSHLSEAEKQNQDDVAGQASEYERELAAKKNETRQMKLANGRMQQEINAVHKENEALKQSAMIFQRENAELVDDLTRVHSKMTTAREFIDRELNAFGNAVDVAHPKLQILSELVQKDKEEARRRRYEEIAGMPLGTTFLQVGLRTVSQSDPESMQPSDLLESLRQSLDELSREQNTSELALKESFESELRAESEVLETLRKNQEQLNVTRSFELELKGKLTAAVEALNNTHEQLLERSHIAAQFVHALAAKPLPQGTPPRGSPEFVPAGTFDRLDLGLSAE